MENFGKTAVFPGGYGRIGEIPHGRIWPDWGLKDSTWGHGHLYLTCDIEPYSDI